MVVAATRLYAGDCHNHPKMTILRAIQLLQKGLTGRISPTDDPRPPSRKGNRKRLPNRHAIPDKSGVMPEIYCG
jgi:hypothetical protein